MNQKRKEQNLVTDFFEPFQRFLRIEAAGGIILFAAAIVALVLANSRWSDWYHHFWEQKLTISVGFFTLSKTFHHWINDGLMAIFFFVVGLEIKRELLVGELSTLKQASLPIAAALGGMIVPALLYLTLNSNPESQSGWGIPMATDIAFSLGILSLLGKRVPVSLKIFLLAFAIVDDLGAVLVIALFYSHDIHWSYLLIGLSLILVLFIFNRLKIKTIPPYMLVGWVIWYLFYESGIHPTIAGVIIAFSIPLKRTINTETFRNNMLIDLEKFQHSNSSSKRTMLTNSQIAAIDNMESRIFNVQSPVQRLEHILHGFVTYIVMPVFALANAGVVLKGIHAGDILTGISGTIIIGLVLGKVIGISLFSWISVRTGLAQLPQKINWRHIVSISFLGGMGFTMSLFITSLAFESESLLNPAKLGILAASLIAALSGYSLLRFTLKNRHDSNED